MEHHRPCVHSSKELTRVLSYFEFLCRCVDQGTVLFVESVRSCFLLPGMVIMNDRSRDSAHRRDDMQAKFIVRMLQAQ